MYIYYMNNLKIIFENFVVTFLQARLKIRVIFFTLTGFVGLCSKCQADTNMFFF